jgi:hypothetical protein
MRGKQAMLLPAYGGIVSILYKVDLNIDMMQQATRGIFW